MVGALYLVELRLVLDSRTKLDIKRDNVKLWTGRQRFETKIVSLLYDRALVSKIDDRRPRVSWTRTDMCKSICMLHGGIAYGCYHVLKK